MQIKKLTDRLTDFDTKRQPANHHDCPTNSYQCVTK